MSFIESGKKQGAKLVSGGTRVGDRGYFIAPTVFADVKDDMKIAQEEVRILIPFLFLKTMIFLDQTFHWKKNFQFWKKNSKKNLKKKSEKKIEKKSEKNTHENTH